MLVPVWTIATSDLIDSIQSTLGHIYSDWALFKVDSMAKYLGVYMGPGADDRAQWAAPAAKWYHRSQILGDSHAAIQLNVSHYNTAAITCLTYVGQLFPAPELVLTKEIHALHKIIRSAPSAFSKLDILVMKNWAGAAVPIGIEVLLCATLWRSATSTIQVWPQLIDLDHRHAEAELPMVDVVRGS